MTQYLRDEAARGRRGYRRGSLAFMFGFLLWLIFNHAMGEDWDTRSTAELEFDAWARRQNLAVLERSCLDERPRASDGRVPCGVYFADTLVCDADHLACGTRETVVWCASDDTLDGGCTWQ